MPFLGSQPAEVALTTGDLGNGIVTTAKIAANNIDGTLTKDALIADYSDVTITASDLIMYGDATDSNNTKRDTVQGILDLAGGGAHAQVVTASSTTVTTTTSGIPQDNTIPQNSEGVEVLTLAITPTNASSTLNIFVHVPVWGTAGGGVGTGFALFKDSDAGAIAAGTCSTGTIPNASFSLHHNISAGSTSSQTFKLRIGAGGSGTVGINSNSAATRTYGGVAATTITIFEVLP